MGSSSSSLSELSSNEQLLRLASTECLSPNDPFWNQLLSFSFVIPRNRFHSRLIVTAAVCLLWMSWYYCSVWATGRSDLTWSCSYKL